MIFGAIPSFRKRSKLLQKQYGILTRQTLRLALAKTRHERGFFATLGENIFPVFPGDLRSVLCHRPVSRRPPGENTFPLLPGDLRSGLCHRLVSRRHFAGQPENPIGAAGRCPHFCRPAQISHLRSWPPPPFPRLQQSWGRKASLRFPAEFPRKLNSSSRRSKMGFAQ